MGLGDEYSDRRRRRKSPIQALLPVIGLLLAGAAAAIAFVLAQPAYDLIVSIGASLNTDIPTGEDGLLIASGAAVFLILIMLFASLFAVFAPKPPKNVSEQALGKEKKEREQEKLAAERRKKQMRAKMRQRNRNRDE